MTPVSAGSCVSVSENDNAEQACVHMNAQNVGAVIVLSGEKVCVGVSVLVAVNVSCT